VHECIKEIIGSCIIFLDHLENKTIAKAITSIVGTFCWNWLWFRLTPALKILPLNFMWIDSHSKCATFYESFAISGFLPCLPKSHFSKVTS
jgi:hypothetical protein